MLFKGYGAKVGLGNMRVKAENRMVTLSRDMDNLHEWMPDVSVIQLYNEVNTQTMLTSLKELFGWVCLLGTVFLVIVLSYRIWRDRHLAALKMLHSLPVKKRYRPSSVHKISKN